MWLAVAGFEVIAVLGTTALFWPAGGPCTGSSPGSGHASVTLLADRIPRLAQLTAREPASPAPGDESTALVTQPPAL